MNKQQMFIEISEHLITDKRPSEYLQGLLDEALFQQHPFDMLYRLKETAQSPLYHPEGSVWNHVMLTVDRAAQEKNKSSDPLIFMWAALLHDIGKPSTTKTRKGKITSYDHDKVGEKLSQDFLSVFSRDEVFIAQVSALVRYHMHILYVVKALPFADIRGMLKDTNPSDVALLGYCDRMGRANSDENTERETTALFLSKINKMK